MVDIYLYFSHVLGLISTESGLEPSQLFFFMLHNLSLNRPRALEYQDVF